MRWVTFSLPWISAFIWHHMPKGQGSTDHGQKPPNQKPKQTFVFLKLIFSAICYSNRRWETGFGNPTSANVTWNGAWPCLRAGGLPSLVTGNCPLLWNMLETRNLADRSTKWVNSVLLPTNKWLMRPLITAVRVTEGETREEWSVGLNYLQLQELKKNTWDDWVYGNRRTYVW